MENALAIWTSRLLTAVATATLLAGCTGTHTFSSVAGGSFVPNIQKVTTAKGYHLLYRFAGVNKGDAFDPFGPLTYVDGTFYGTSFDGGSKGANGATCPDGCGTAFRITPTGTENVLYKFGVTKGSGFLPDSSLTEYNGTLYGVTLTGGTTENGVVFGLTTGGTATTLHNFAPGPADGNSANGVIALNGLLYGTAQNGGTHGDGTIFSVDPATGKETTLYNFLGGTEIAFAVDLIPFNNQLYGASVFGGTSDACKIPIATGCGTIFRSTLGGKVQVLYSLKGGTDGAWPTYLTPVGDTLYGVSGYGGGVGCATSTSSGCGTIFEVSKDGVEKVLYRFKGGARDGSAPSGPLTLVNGIFYDTTSGGGAKGAGTIFSVTTSGTERVLYSFAGGSDGSTPGGGITDVDGTLYGVTSFGGNKSCVTKYNTGC